MKPILNALRNPRQRDVGSGNCLDASSRFLVGIDDNDFGGAGGRVSSPVFAQPAFELVVKAASEDELGVQVSRWEGVSEEDEPFRRAEHIGAAIPEVSEDRAIEVFQVCRRNNQWRVAAACPRLYRSGMHKGLDALSLPFVMENVDKFFL